VSVEANRALVHRYIDEVWNAGGVELLDELYDPGFTGGSYGGLAGLKAAIASYRTSFPDLRLAVDETIGEDDRIVYRWTARGTHLGEYDGVAPSGRPMTVTGLTLLRIVEGRIVDDYSETSIADLRGQLEQG
jgi:steroid delta-isomerase-like uncharacterized protein